MKSSVSGFAIAEPITESYRIATDVKTPNAPACRALAEKAIHDSMYESQKVARFGGCECREVGDVQGKSKGKQCRLTLFLDGNPPSGTSTIVIPRFD